MNIDVKMTTGVILILIGVTLLLRREARGVKLEKLQGTLGKMLGLRKPLGQFARIDILILGPLFLIVMGVLVVIARFAGS